MEVPTLKTAENEITAVKSNATSNERKFCKSKKPLQCGGGYATGSRKRSVARVWVRKGTGKISINKKNVDNYFGRDLYRTTVLEPFSVTNTPGQYDVWCTVAGGGLTGQADAIRHGISKALDCISEDFHFSLHKAKLLTRNPKEVERKKYGRRKARKLRQFSKR